MNNGQASLKEPRSLINPGPPAAPGTAIAVVPGGNWILSAGLDFQLRLWDVSEGKCIKSWDARGPINSIRVDSSGTTALLGAVQGIVSWDLERWELAEPPNFWSHAEITAVWLFEPDNLALGASEDTTIHRWDYLTGEKLSSLVGHAITVTCLTADQAGRLLLSADLYGHLCLWDAQSGERLQHWQGHQKGVTATCLSPDGTLAVSSSQDGEMILWDAQNLKALTRIEAQPSDLNDLIFLAEDMVAISAGHQGISCWSLEKGMLRSRSGNLPVFKLASSASGKFLAGLVKSNHIQVWPL